MRYLLILWLSFWSVAAQEQLWLHTRTVASISGPPSGPLLWAKPESLVTNDNGAKIVSTGSFDGWLDSSGNGNHITNSVSADVATVLTNQIGGFNAAVFDGTTNSMYVPPLDLGTNWVVAIVYKELIGDFSLHPFLWNSNDLIAAAVLVADPRAMMTRGGEIDTVSVDNYVATAYHSAVWMCSNGVMSYYFNGKDITDPGNFLMTTNQIVTLVGAKADGGDVNGTTPAFVEILVYDRYWTLADEQQHETYISNRFGLFPPTGPIAGYTAWYVADDIALANDDPVVTWEDSSANNLDLSQNQGARQPLLKTAVLNGHDVVRFDDSNDYLESSVGISNFVASGSYTIFVVCTLTEITTDNADGTTYENQGIYADSGGFFGAFLRLGYFVKAYNYDGSSDVASVSTTLTTHLFEVRHESGNIYVSQDGGSEVSVASGNTSVMTGLFRLGANYGGNATINGDIAEVIIYNTPLSSGDRSTNRTYLADKYEIELE